MLHPGTHAQILTASVQTSFPLPPPSTILVWNPCYHARGKLIKDYRQGRVAAMVKYRSHAQDRYVVLTVKRD
jgi:CRISPR/Cas system-associated protein Cas5 (RAMP superfamily)